MRFQMQVSQVRLHQMSPQLHLTTRLFKSARQKADKLKMSSKKQLQLTQAAQCLLLTWKVIKTHHLVRYNRSSHQILRFHTSKLEQVIG